MKPFAVLPLLILALTRIAEATPPASLPAVFTCGSAMHHAVTLSATTTYGSGAAFGFDEGTAPSSFAGGACSGSKAFFFSLAEPDGNYRVTLVLGGPAASTNTVRAESRRLFVDELAVPAGGSKTVVFNVNVRTKVILPAPTDGAAEVKLKPREIGAADWDEKLTLEFNGENPSVRSISIQPIANVPTVYIAGDSTVVDQDKEPWAAWGQMLPVFFGPGISIANEAESGETIRSFVGERRYAKVMSTIKRGDFLMIQFGHNDQKAGDTLKTDFRGSLKQFIADARAHGATPILVTPMNRRNFDADGHIVQTLADYPDAFREVAASEKVALIDLNALSKTLFEALGDAGTLHAFVHYPANTFPDQPAEMKDNTHFNSYGAYELARAVVESMRAQHLSLAKYLKPGIPAFDPAHPLPFAEFKLPPSPSFSAETPYEKK